MTTVSSPRTQWTMVTTSTFYDCTVVTDGGRHHCPLRARRRPPSDGLLPPEIGRARPHAPPRLPPARQKRPGTTQPPALSPTDGRTPPPGRAWTPPSRPHKPPKQQDPPPHPPPAISF